MGLILIPGRIFKDVQTVAIGAFHLAVPLEAHVYARVTKCSATAVTGHFFCVDYDGLRRFNIHALAPSFSNPQVIAKRTQGDNDLQFPQSGEPYIDLRTSGMIAIAGQNLEGMQP